jgi:hypothetical protein
LCDAELCPQRKQPRLLAGDLVASRGKLLSFLPRRLVKFRETLSDGNLAFHLPSLGFLSFRQLF